MGVARFEELVVWQKAKRLSVSVYRLTGSGGLARDFGLKDQMQRAAVSVMSNVAEGFERNSRKEFARFLDISIKSTSEAEGQLELARDYGILQPSLWTKLQRKNTDIRRMLCGLRKKVLDADERETRNGRTGNAKRVTGPRMRRRRKDDELTG